MLLCLPCMGEHLTLVIIRYNCMRYHLTLVIIRYNCMEEHWTLVIIKYNYLKWELEMLTWVFLFSVAILFGSLHVLCDDLVSVRQWRWAAVPHHCHLFGVLWVALLKTRDEDDSILNMMCKVSVGSLWSWWTTRQARSVSHPSDKYLDSVGAESWNQLNIIGTYLTGLVF